MTRQDFVESLRRVLREISPPLEEDYQLDLNYVSKASERLPLPYMVFLTLLSGTNCKYVPKPFDKTAWSIHLRFKDVPFRLEHGKFGMRIATTENSSSQLVDELIEVLHRAFPVADQVLQPFVDAQVMAGNVTIPNQHHKFHNRYEFFRYEARKAFDSTRPPLVRDPSKLADGTAQTVDVFKPEREGFFFGSAAIDSYFSWLEHILVLILPFVGYDPSSDNLVEFIRGSWSDKLKKVWCLNSDKELKSLYDALHEIKERFRNPLAHGGFEKSGTSLGVHMQGLGAIPFRLSRFTESIHYGVFPLKDASFDEACDLFDKVDVKLRNGSTRYGMKFVESGLDVAFDKDSCDEYKSAMCSDEEFDKLLDRLSYFADMHTNMDW